MAGNKAGNKQEAKKSKWIQKTRIKKYKIPELDYNKRCHRTINLHERTVSVTALPPRAPLGGSEKNPGKNMPGIETRTGASD